MIHLYFLPILAILSLGSFGAEKLRRKKFYEFNFYEWFAESWLIGSFLLIVPMIVTSVLFANRMYHVVYGYYMISLLILLYYVITVTANIRPSQIIKPETITKTTEYKLYSIIIILLMLGYLFIAFLYPERGWDALQFYFPNAIYFYLRDDIPSTINPFTFFPTFKPPSNTLFLVYSFYTTEGFFAQLYPVVFLMSIVCATVIYATDLGISKRKAQISSIFLLTTPAVYVTMIEYSFYQEFPVTFYYSMGIIYYRRGLKNGSLTDFIIASLGISLAVLSKLSGFTIIVLLLILFPIIQNKNEKRIRYILLVALGLFLARKASYDTFIGVGLVIIFILLALLIQLKRTDKNNYSTLKPNSTGLILSVIIYITTLALWIRHMLLFPKTMEFLRKLYFERNSKSISWNFPSNKLLSEVYLENAHGTNFFTAVLAIFIASQFGLFLALPKVIGILKSYNDYPSVNLWLGTFYMLWLAFHSTVSIRYLSIIWIPLSIVTVLGIDEIISFFKVKQYSDHIFLLLIFTNFLFYYSFIPFEFIFLDFHSRLLQYHVSLFRLLIYFSLFWGGAYYILIKLRDRNVGSVKEFDPLSYNNQKGVVILLSAMIVIAPISAQIVVLTYTRYDIDEFQNIWVYDNRQTVQELVDFMIELNYDVDRGTIVVNIPGLGYWLTRPVIDLLFASEYLEVNQSKILVNSNTTEVFLDLKENDIDYVVTLLENHVFYESYTKIFEVDYPFLAVLNSTFGFSMFSNDEFELWQLI